MDLKVERFYLQPGLTEYRLQTIGKKIKLLIQKVKESLEDISISAEICFNVGILNEGLNEKEKSCLEWIFSHSFKEENLSNRSWIKKRLEDNTSMNHLIVEIGPRLNFSTAWSTNAVSVCQSIGLKNVARIEKSVRYLIERKGKEEISAHFTKDEEELIIKALHDPMTECQYHKPLENFKIDVKTEACYEIDIMNEGKKALEKANTMLGLSFDDWDLEYYFKLFKEKLQRNPTSVECFDLAQSNSEHSRHWFFRGDIVIDGESMPNTLMKMVMNTQKTTNDNSIIKFNDNSSAIKGFEVNALRPVKSFESSNFCMDAKRKRHITLTAETHNFPTGVAPFPGATTGTGGRIRDNHATGTGAHVVAGTAGYCFGNLNIPGYPLPWEENLVYPNNFASPLSIAIEASNGASDYGNKFGEPVIAGFVRSFGMQLEERTEWIKPIMFSAGIGSIEDEHIKKTSPEKGMEVVKIGGPIYRIGVGGGAASSVKVQGDNAEELDFGAVQRGDAEMEQKLNRLIRACIEMGEKNPICSIHDQGAGGNGNVLKEIAEPAGAVIRAKDFVLGDPTISTLELWGAEYQESDAILIRPEDKPLLQKISDREKAPVCFVGTITGDGRIVLDDSKPESSNARNGDETPAKKMKQQYPVDLPLDIVLGKMPPKTFKSERIKPPLSPLRIPSDLTIDEALFQVLRLPSVASKRYLMNKVDRCVTGLIAQQQCVGPLHTPVADVAVTALSMLETVGVATAIGEQPIKGLIDPGCGARMTVGEALTNLVFAQITDIKDIKCSANWMWPAKLPGEAAKLYDACEAMCKTLSELGVAVDGGKDSLSMAARVGDDVVKSPGSLVLSVYAPCPDIRKTVTPDLKMADGTSSLLYVKLSKRWDRLGGSALAQVFGQIGNESPDMDDAKIFSNGFLVTQQILKDELIYAGHDVSDGGIITTLLEMAFSSSRGLTVDFKLPEDPTHGEIKPLDLLFSEELGLVLEVKREQCEAIIGLYSDVGVECFNIGITTMQDPDCDISVAVNGEVVLHQNVAILRDSWQDTSFQLDKLQANKECVYDEQQRMLEVRIPRYNVTFDTNVLQTDQMQKRPKVAVVREEGSNGDREMVATLYLAGFEVWDVTMQDICSGTTTLDGFQGLVFVGGFSFADVFGSAKGWAAVARFNENARKELEKFRLREDTFSLGICNGCQLMALLGWVGSENEGDKNTLPVQGTRFTHNISERFECRFPTVKILKSPAIMLKDMENTEFGIWIAHGEGRAEFKSESVMSSITEQHLAPIRYVTDGGVFTEEYPYNPNGSPEGITALCSRDGRHLAMMPHPERSSLLWQLPYIPHEMKHLKQSPWLKMFCNAFDWCQKENC